MDSGLQKSLKAGFSVKFMKKVHVGPNDVRSESQLGPAPVSGRVQKLGLKKSA